jgi:hypothetical protein
MSADEVRILVIDDDENNRYTLTSRFRREEPLVLWSEHLTAYSFDRAAPLPIGWNNCDHRTRPFRSCLGETEFHSSVNYFLFVTSSDYLHKAKLHG